MAAEVSARVHLVAEKLQLRAQDAQRKGNAGAAAALADSVRDLRQATALIAEQAHLLACRRGEDGDGRDSAEEEATETEELLGRLTKVEQMLGKKSDEMKAKGNENAAASLRQSAGAVGVGRRRIAESQQRVYGLQERWDVVAAVALEQKPRRNSRRRSSSGRSGLSNASDVGERGELNEDALLADDEVVKALKDLVALKELLMSRFPGCSSADEFASALDSANETVAAPSDGGDRQEELARAEERVLVMEERVQALQDECEKLKFELKTTKARHAEDLEVAEKNAQLLRDESTALEESLSKLEEEYNARREQEIAHLQAIYDSQRNANDELEQILSEKDVEIAALKKNAESDGAEIEHLRSNVDAMTRESAQNQQVHQRQIQELRQQLQDSRDSPTRESSDEQCQDEDGDKYGQALDGDGAAPVVEQSTVKHQVEEEELSDKTGVSSTTGDISFDALTELPVLQARMMELNDLLETHQGTIASLRLEREELQRSIELLQSSVQDKERGMTELKSKSQEQLDALTQQIADRDSTIDMLSSKLAQELETMSTVHSNAISKLEEELTICKSDFAACSSALQDKDAEIDRLRVDLDVNQGKDAELAQLRAEASLHSNDQGEWKKVADHLALVTAELADLSSAIDPTKPEQDIVLQLGTKEWSTPEIASISNSLTAQLDVMIALKNQVSALETTRDQLGASILATSAALVQSTLGSRDDVEEPSGDPNAHLDWMSRTFALLSAERTKLTGLVNEYKSSCDKLQHELEANAAELNSARDEKTDLETLCSSLKEQITVLKQTEADIQTEASELKVQLMAAKEQQQTQNDSTNDKVEALEQELAAVRSEFERYRTKSHTALKKMEKRAELLNGMRKENEKLIQQVTESDHDREQAQQSVAQSTARLEEVMRSQQMLQLEFEQYVEEKTKVIVALEEQIQEVSDARDAAATEVTTVLAQIQRLEHERIPELEATASALQTELDGAKSSLAASEAAVASLKLEKEQLQSTIKGQRAEVTKLQALVHDLEHKIQEQASAASAALRTAQVPPPQVLVTAPPPQLPPAEVDDGRMEVLEKEVAALRLAKASLDEEVVATRDELVALQEKFATIKAAHADKVFTLEERCQMLETRLASDRAETQSAGLAAEPMPTAPAQTQSLSTPVESKRASELDKAAEAALKDEVARMTSEIDRLSSELTTTRQSRDELQSKIATLTATADQYKTQLEDVEKELALAHNRLGAGINDAHEATSDDGSEKDSDKHSSAAMEQAMKRLRQEVRRLQDEVQELNEEKEKWEHDQAERDLEQLRGDRLEVQRKKEDAMKYQQRKVLVAAFEQQVDVVVKDLQKYLEEHAQAFRDACAFRDARRSKLPLANGDLDNGDAVSHRRAASTNKYEECLVMTSGVVVKAGSNFQLPVVCAKKGWRVVWNFSVKEDDADVTFTLKRDGGKDKGSTAANDQGLTVLVEPDRVASLSGIVDVDADDTTLLFEWDNSFSWLNAKTLDYHVSVQEPLSVAQQQVRVEERKLEEHAQSIRDGLSVLEVEASRRAALQDALTRLDACDDTRKSNLAVFAARKQELSVQKSELQQRMEEMKAALSAAIQQQDEINDDEKRLGRVWEDAAAERDDVEMTLKLSGSGQLDDLRDQLQELQAELAAGREQQKQRSAEKEAEQEPAQNVDADAVVEKDRVETEESPTN